MLDEVNPDQFILYAIAQEYVKHGNDTLAEQYFLRLKGLNPTYTGLYYHLAALYIRSDDSEKAMKTFNEGIAVSKKVRDLHALSELQNAKMNFEIDL